MLRILFFELFDVSNEYFDYFEVTVESCPVERGVARDVLCEEGGEVGVREKVFDYFEMAVGRCVVQECVGILVLDACKELGGLGRTREEGREGGLKVLKIAVSSREEELFDLVAGQRSGFV